MSNSLRTPSDVFEDQPAVLHSGLNLSWRERRDQLRARLQQNPPAGLGTDEVEVHFSGMPARYWEQVNERDLVWGLETVHGFLASVAMPNSSATKPFVNWRHAPESTCMRIMLCTWDRHGLLAKAAAAFSAVRLNIIQADVFTRADNIVLDLFHVTEGDGRSGVSPIRLEEMTFVLDGALSEPPRFASVWACSRHKFLAPPPRIPPQITFDNDPANQSTVVHVEASDRLGLLYDVLQAMADSDLSVTGARIETRHDMAHDVIHVTDSQGRKILDLSRLEELRRNLETALNVRE